MMTVNSIFIMARVTSTLLKAVQVSRDDFRPVSKIYDIMMLRPEEHGWERFGMNNDDEVTCVRYPERGLM